MDIRPCGSIDTRRGSSDRFTGTAWQELIAEAEPPARIRASLIRFDPGARTHWHTHPLGQTLYIVAGSGLVQSEGEPVREIHAGDVVWIPPGEKHWHGARPNAAMIHIAMQEAQDGETVDLLESVTDEQYFGHISGQDAYVSVSA